MANKVKCLTWEKLHKIINLQHYCRDTFDIEICHNVSLMYELQRLQRFLQMRHFL